MFLPKTQHVTGLLIGNSRIETPSLLPEISHFEQCVVIRGAD
jgi:hypothetical protein